MLQKALKNICSERRLICTRENLHIVILNVSLSAVTMRKKRIEDCRTCPYCGDTVEERMAFINQMAESYGIKKHGSVTRHISSVIVQVMLLK